MPDNREALNLIGDNKIIKFVNNPVAYYESKMLEYIRYYEPEENIQVVYDDLQDTISKNIQSYNRARSGIRGYVPVKYGDKRSLPMLASACCLRAWWNEATLERGSREIPKAINFNRALRLEAMRKQFGSDEYEIYTDSSSFFKRMDTFTHETLLDDGCAKLLASTHKGLTPVLNIDRFAEIIYKEGIERYPLQNSSTQSKKELEIISHAFKTFKKELSNVLYYCDFTQVDPLTT